MAWVDAATVEQSTDDARFGKGVCEMGSSADDVNDETGGHGAGCGSDDGEDNAIASEVGFPDCDAGGCISFYIGGDVAGEDDDRSYGGSNGNESTHEANYDSGSADHGTGECREDDGDGKHDEKETNDVVSGNDKGNDGGNAGFGTSVSALGDARAGSNTGGETKGYGNGSVPEVSKASYVNTEGNGTDGGVGSARVWPAACDTGICDVGISQAVEVGCASDGSAGDLSMLLSVDLELDNALRGRLARPQMQDIVMRRNARRIQHGLDPVPMPPALQHP